MRRLSANRLHGRVRSLAGALALVLLCLGAGPAMAAGSGSGGAASPAAADAQGDSPAATIKYLHASLIEVMKHAKQLGYDGRYRKLKPVIEQTHDLAYLARLTLGSHWDKLDSDQQSRFVTAFRQLTIATYAARFDGYSGEAFRFDGSRQAGSGQSVVRSTLVQSDGGNVNFDYVLHRTDGQWKIINIVVNGVSDLAMKRAQYTDLLQRKGFPALLKTIHKRIAGYGGAH
ncbi:MAG TPA: ABC transporter substrate-binding protein [Gammaproteobacteria bacterium]|nr:ABC transporter substrate-binding protein [Gammaproteobacteria bacterium]